MGSNSKGKNAGISNLQGILSIFVLLIHSASSNMNIPGRELQSVHGLNYSSFIQMFLSEGVCRVAVPCFFILSGYLYYSSFNGSFQNYIEKNKRRIHTLLIPYLVWSSLVFIAFALAQRVPVLSGYFTTRNDSGFTFQSILHNVILNSYNSPLWYVRYLIVFSVLSIALYPVYKKLPLLALLLLFYGWFFNFAGIAIHVPFRMDAAFFYSVGAMAGVHQDYLTKLFARVKKMNKKWILVLTAIYLLILGYHSWKLCSMPNTFLLEGEYNSVIDFVGKTGILLGSFLILWMFLSNPSNNEWQWVQYSFLLFVLHHPIVNTVKKLIIKMLGGTLSPALSLITFIACVIITFVLVVGFGKLLKRMSPNGYKIMVGSR